MDSRVKNAVTELFKKRDKVGHMSLENAIVSAIGCPQGAATVIVSELVATCAIVKNKGEDTYSLPHRLPY